MGITYQDIVGLDICFFSEPFVQLSNSAAGDPQALDICFFAEPIVYAYAIDPVGGVVVGEEKAISATVDAVTNLSTTLNRLRKVNHDVSATSGLMFDALMRLRSTPYSLSGTTDLNVQALQRLRNEGFAVFEESEVLAAISKDGRIGLNIEAPFSVQGNTNLVAAFNRLRADGVYLSEHSAMNAMAGVTRHVAFNPTSGTAMVMSLPRKRSHGSLAVHGDASFSEMFVTRVRFTNYEIDVHCDTEVNFNRAMDMVVDIDEVVDVIESINRERATELTLEEKALLDFNMIAVQLTIQKWTVVVYDKKVVVGRDGVYRVVTTKTRHKL